MTEDATLDSFGSAEESAATSGATEESGAAESTDAESANAKSTDDTPPTPTSSWRPAGECASCGEHVARRWRDGDEHVCGECVSWNASGGDACDQ